MKLECNYDHTLTGQPPRIFLGKPYQINFIDVMQNAIAHLH